MASLTKFEVHFVTLIRGHWTQLQLNFVRFAGGDKPCAFELPRCPGPLPAGDVA